MQNKNELRAQVEKIVEWNVDSGIIEAHTTFNTDSGDITPEQDDLLRELKDKLTTLVTELVHQNLF